MASSLGEKVVQNASYESKRKSPFVRMHNLLIYHISTKLDGHYIMMAGIMKDWINNRAPLIWGDIKRNGLKNDNVLKEIGIAIQDEFYSSPFESSPFENPLAGLRYVN